MGFSHIFAIDSSRKALDSLSRLIGNNSETVRFIQCDATSENFPDLNGVDLWHDRTFLHFLRDEGERQRYLDNMRRTLRVNGYVILVEHSKAGPGYCSGLPLFKYSVEHFKEFLGEGFSLHESFIAYQSTPSGDKRSLIYAIFRRVS